MPWLKSLKANVRFKEPLSAHTSLSVGGPADIWAQPENYSELKKIVCFCLKQQKPYIVVGKGANILASDRGFRGVALYLNAPAFTKMEIKETCIRCGAGLPLAKLLRETEKRGLTGLEFLAGIPATVAGAVVMNAGTRTNGLGNFVKGVTVMDKKGKLRRFKKRQLKFAYRQSNLNNYIVLEVELALTRKNAREVKQNIAAQLAQKRKTQDLRAKSAGCIFKNPQHPLTAGEMIEACGLKQRRKGGAEISPRHANYIINRNRAKARDILYLIHLAQREVKKKFGVLLEPEIRILE